MKFITGIIPLLAKNRQVRDSLIVSSGTAVGQIVTFLSMPVISRIYTPEKFGLYALFISIAGICSNMATLRYDSIIVLQKDNASIKDAFHLNLILCCIFFIFVTPIFFIINSFFLSFEKLNNIALYTLLFGSLWGINIAGASWLNKKAFYNRIAISRVVQSSVYVLVALALGLLDVEYGLIIGQCVALLVVFGMTVFWIPELFQKIKFSRVISIAKDHISTPRYYLPTTLSDMLSRNAPIFFYSAVVSQDMAGQFSMAWSVIMAPIILISASVGQVFYQKMAHLWSEGRTKEAKSLIYKTWILLSVVGVLPFSVLTLYGDSIFSVVFGEQWAISGSLAEYLSPMALFTFVSSSTSSIYLVLGMQKKLFLFGLATLAYRPLTLGVGYFSDDLFLGLSLFCVFEILLIIFFNFYALRNINIKG